MKQLLLLAGVFSLGNLLAMDELEVPVIQEHLDSGLMARAHQPERRFHPTKHFDSYSDVSFDGELQSQASQIASRSASSVGSHRGGGGIAMADGIEVQGAHVQSKPVSNADYYRFVKATGHAAPKHWKKGKYPDGKADEPVVNVSYADAKAYALWANKRLPSHLEWLNAQDQFSEDFAAPAKEWTTSPSPEGPGRQIILDASGTTSTMFQGEANLDTGFRVAMPKLHPSEFMTPEGNTITPDDQLQAPDGLMIEPSGNPSDFDE